MKCCCGENNFQVSLNKDHQCTICYSQSVVSSNVITGECLLGARSIAFLMKIHHIEKSLLSQYWSAEISQYLNFQTDVERARAFQIKVNIWSLKHIFLPLKKDKQVIQVHVQANFTTTNSCPNWFFTDFCLARWISVCSSCEHLP